MSDDDRKNIKTLQKFLKGNVFEDTSRRLESIVRRPQLINHCPDHEVQVAVVEDFHKCEGTNDELNHYYYDHLHLQKEANKFHTKLLHRDHHVEEEDVGCCGMTVHHADHDSDDECHPEDEVDKWTITQAGTLYTVSLPFIVFANIHSSIFYPVYTILSYERELAEEKEKIDGILGSKVDNN